MMGQVQGEDMQGDLSPLFSQRKRARFNKREILIVGLILIKYANDGANLNHVCSVTLPALDSYMFKKLRKIWVAT